MSRITHARGASVRERHFHRDKRTPQINLGNYKLSTNATYCTEGAIKLTDIKKGTVMWSGADPFPRLSCDVDTSIIDSPYPTPDNPTPMLCKANQPIDDQNSEFTVVCQQVNDYLYPPPASPIGLTLGVAIGGLAVASTVGAALAVYCAYKMYKRCTDPERENLIVPEVRQQRLFEPRVFTNAGIN